MSIKDKIIEIVILVGCGVFLGLTTFAGYLMITRAEEKKNSVVEECVNKIYILPTEKIYMHPFGTVEDPYREDLHGDIENSCIRSLRSFGVDIPYGIIAKDLKPNTDIKIGVVAIFTTKDGNGHGAMVTKIEIEKKGFWVKEGNYVEGKITERFIFFDDNRLRGYYEYGKN